MVKNTQKAGFFLLRNTHVGRPQDDSIVHALLGAGYKVDIFAPGLAELQNFYPASVQFFSVEYRLDWLKKNLNYKRWKAYDLLLGTSDLPMAMVGILGVLTGCKTITVCDEVYGGGYQGQGNFYWTIMAKFGMRRSLFTVITDFCRVELQREYARLSRNHRFIQYPCCFPDDRLLYDAPYWRQKLGIKEDTCLLSISGYTGSSSGVHWAIHALDQLPSRYHLLIQPGSDLDPLVHALFQQISRNGRIIYLPGRLYSFVEAMSINQAADIGLVFYLSQQPQFQKMGISSNKLCMYLHMGKPVVATRQESFEFLEKYGAGILIDSKDELPEAIVAISTNYEKYSRAARECFRDYVQPDKRFVDLTQAFKDL